MRIWVIGHAGAGKSTTAHHISDHHGIRVVSLDAYVWDRNWQRRDEEEVVHALAELLAADDWIVDGYYPFLAPPLIDACDRIVYLEVGLPRRLFRLIKRTTSDLLSGKRFPGGGKQTIGAGLRLLAWTILSNRELCDSFNATLLDAAAKGVSASKVRATRGAPNEVSQIVEMTLDLT